MAHPRLSYLGRWGIHLLSRKLTLLYSIQWLLTPPVQNIIYGINRITYCLSGAGSANANLMNPGIVRQTCTQTTNCNWEKVSSVVQICTCKHLLWWNAYTSGVSYSMGWPHWTVQILCWVSLGDRRNLIPTLMIFTRPKCAGAILSNFCTRRTNTTKEKEDLSHVGNRHSGESPARALDHMGFFEITVLARGTLGKHILHFIIVCLLCSWFP